MQIGLKGKIKSIVEGLKAENKHRLAECIEKNWNKTALAYSRELNTWKPQDPMEKELLSAFDKELERLGILGPFKTDILDSIKKRRVIQTGPHLGATEGPRMLCINWLGSLGVPEEDSYVVGMFSGIPFSNRSRPGRINREKDSINLFPSNMQDGLVYRSVINKKLLENINALPKEGYKFLAKTELGESYTKWALGVCANIERKILEKRNLVFLDINEVITEYLRQVLPKPDHIFHKIFFKKKFRKEFIKSFPREIMFYTPTVDGKYEKMENMSFSNSGKELKSKSKEIKLNNPENLIKELKDNRLCPALITSFMALAFLNQFKCFGSFAQVEYLPVYQKKISKLSFMKKLQVEKVPTANLTTGVFPESHNLYPADIVLKSEYKKFRPKDSVLFGELLLPMKEVLLESYFTGDARKK